MLSQKSSDTGFIIIVLIMTIALTWLYIVYDQNNDKEERVLSEAKSYLKDRKAEKPSRSQERNQPEELPLAIPTIKPKVTPSPKPSPVQTTPTPTPTQTKTTNTKAKTQTSSGLPSLLLTIREHESGGNYRAYNPSGCIGGCYGAYQLTAEYMDDWAREAGYPNYAYVGFWPPEIQDAVALYKFNQTGGDLWCDWTDYC
jgi:type II secretory pathway pseudopilin PulG